MSNIARVAGQAANTTVKPLDIDDVFSTYLYEGTGSAQTITNGIDLDGEGGLVWTKSRTSTSAHGLYDTERGASKELSTSSTVAESSDNGVTAFNSNGYVVGNRHTTNSSGNDYASWTFRKAPKFFTCLTYSGTGPGSSANEQQVSHDLGAKPGIVMIKRTDATGDWWVFTDVIDGSNDYGYLNQSAAFGNSANNVATDSVFNVGGVLNTSGATYVAYLFAHNDGDGDFGPTGDQDIIKCGSYTGTGAAGNFIDLGFEPQWVFYKRTDGANSWVLQDNMRGMSHTSRDFLYANSSGAEQSSTLTAGAKADPNGFILDLTGGDHNASGGEYIYIAIRRGPLAVPEDATEVFKASLGDSTVPGYDAPFAVDMAFNRYKISTAGNTIYSRLTGPETLATSSTRAASSDSSGAWDYMDGWYDSGRSSDFISWMWKRAPGFFDAVAFSGNSTAGRTVSHNLGVAPEMMWVKSRDLGNSIRNWCVYHTGTGNTKSSFLNLTDTPITSINFWNNTDPTDASFSLGAANAVNTSGEDYIAYLFASAPGVSKVGSYTGNGTSQTIDCGFTSGARFILVKRTDSTGDWYVWDTERGIVAGNDPYLELNTTDAEVTSTDWVDPDNSGFIVNGTTINASSASYIFYAIA